MTYTKEQIELITTNLEYQTERELHDAFDAMLDETTERVSLLGMTYAPSDVLKNVDPIAYRCGFNDWLDSMDDVYTCVDNEYYLVSDVEGLLEEVA